MPGDETSTGGPLEYAVRQYHRLLDEARRGERPFDEDATLRALARDTGVTVEELRAALLPSPPER
jgi:hypothetical protein